MKTRIDGQVFWRCNQCQSSMTTLNSFVFLCGEESEGAFRKAPRELEARHGKQCGCCERPMAEVSPFESADAHVLDFCPDCHFIVFDPKEWFKTYANFRDSGQAASFLELQGRSLKVLRVDTPRRRQQREAYWEAFRKKAKAREHFKVIYSPEEKGGAWRLVAMAGFPLEEWQPEFRETPYLTWLLVVVTSGVSLYAFTDVFGILFQYAFIPALFPETQWWRSLSSFFLHGGVLHLIGNMYYLWIFGDNVEDYLGKLRYIFLLVAATFIGAVAHWAMNPNSPVPCVGASGGISGIIAFYALQFPRARIAIAPPIVSPVFAIFWLIRFKVGWALLIWFVMQFCLIFLQVSELSNVSAAAHLGGALTGVIFWKLWRMRVL